MESTPNNTPIIIGTGQSIEQVPNDLSSAASHADMAGRAAAAAVTDAGISAASIDHIACTRIFSDSTPAYLCPFGGADKFSLAVAARIGASPSSSLYDSLGGQTPQSLVAECAEGLLSGAYDVAMIAGGEALANMRAAQRGGAKLDWSETHDGSFEDRGLHNWSELIDATEINHRMTEPMMFYGMMETARRISQDEDVETYRNKMATLLAPMSKAASENPYAMFPKHYSPAELATESPDNRPLISPYTKYLVAKDGVNQSAAIIMTTVGKAKVLGIDPTQWIYLHGASQASERHLLKREDMGQSAAMVEAFNAAMSQAGVTGTDIAHFDLYSCFPIVVSLAKDVLGMSETDPRALTQTGGLPFFGGPGNNYTLHGIASMVETLRSNPNDLGLVYGNGGWMSKHAVGIYAARPPETPWTPSQNQWQDTSPIHAFTDIAEGPANIESYIVRYKRGEPIGAIIIGRLDLTKERFYANLEDPHESLLKSLAAGELTDTPITVTGHKSGNKFRFN